MSVRWIAYRRGVAVDSGSLEPSAELRSICLARRPCDSVVVSNSLTNTDASENTFTVLIGSSGIQPFELAPGDSTEQIPVSFVSDVYVAPLSGELSLSGLTFTTTCTLPEIGMVGDELEIRKQVGTGEFNNRGCFSDQSIPWGVVEFRFSFPGTAGVCEIGLAEVDAPACSPIAGSQLGWEVGMAFLSPPPFGQAIPRQAPHVGPVLFNPIAYNTDDIYKITVDPFGVARYWRNSGLLAVSDINTLGVPLHVDVAMQTPTSGIFLRRFAQSLF